MAHHAAEANQFLYEIPKGLNIGDLVEIRGRKSSYAKWIALEFALKRSVKNGRTVLSEANRTAVPFKLRLNIDGSWEAFALLKDTEFHQTGRWNVDFHASSEFCINVVSLQDHFQVYWGNDNLVCKFRYRIGLKFVTHLLLSGDAQFQALEFLDSRQFLVDYKNNPNVATSTDIKESTKKREPKQETPRIEVETVTPNVPNANGKKHEETSSLFLTVNGHTNGRRDSESETVSVSSSRMAIDENQSVSSRCSIRPLSAGQPEPEQPVVVVAEKKPEPESILATTPAAPRAKRSVRIVINDEPKPDAAAEVIDTSPEGLLNEALKFDKYATLHDEKEPVPVRVGSVAYARGLVLSNANECVFAISTTERKNWMRRQLGHVTIVIHLRLQPFPIYRAFFIDGQTCSLMYDDTRLPVNNFARDRELKIAIHHKYKCVTIFINGCNTVNFNFKKLFENLHYKFPYREFANITIAGDLHKESLKFEFPAFLVLPHYDEVEQHLAAFHRPEVVIDFTPEEAGKGNFTFGFTGDEAESPEKAHSALICNLDFVNGKVTVGTTVLGKEETGSAKSDAEELKHLSGEHEITFRIGSKDYQILLDGDRIISCKKFLPPKDLKYLFINEGNYGVRFAEYNSGDFSPIEVISLAEKTPSLSAEPIQTLEKVPMARVEPVPTVRKSSTVAAVPTVEAAPLLEQRTKKNDKVDSSERTLLSKIRRTKLAPRLIDLPTKETDSQMSGLLVEGVIDLQKYSTLAEKMEPDTIRVCQYANVHAVPQSNATECLFAVSSAGKKVWPLCMAGEVAILIHMHYHGNPMVRAFLLNGPICTALGCGAPNAAKLLRQKNRLTFTVQHRFNSVAILVDNQLIVDYDYKKNFDSDEYELHFPATRMKYLTLAGDFDENSVQFEFPTNLMLPYFNEALINLLDVDNGEARIDFNVPEGTGWFRVAFMQDCAETPDESSCTLKCEFDPNSGRISIAGERYGKLIGPTRNFDAKSLVNLRGNHQLTFRNGQNDYQILLDLATIVTCEQFVPSSCLKYVFVGNNRIVLNKVDFFPKNRSSGNPCCSACTIQ